jgi:TMEM175 potassium channel family protein
MGSDDPSWIAGTLDLERLLVLSDGVFAIAVTLSAFQIQVPSSPDHLTAELARLWPKVVIYAFSFFVIAGMWTTHHRMFHFIRRADARLVALNLVALAIIAFMPFPVELVGTYGDQAVSVVVYAAAMSLAGGVLSAIWIYATRRRLVADDLPASTVRAVGLRIEIVAILFALSIPLAYLPHGPTIVSWFWVGIFAIRRVLIHRMREPDPGA